MSYLALSHEPPPYQNFDPRTESLARLESACAPYLRAGYKITSHNSDSFVLVRQRAPVSILAVLLLLSMPPLVILYLVITRNRRDRVACVRINSRGVVEESGDTLAALRSASRQSMFAVLAVLAIFGVLVGAIYLHSARSGSHVTSPTTASTSTANATYSNLNASPSDRNTKGSKRKSKAAAADGSYPTEMSNLPPPASFDYPPSPTLTPADVPATSKPIETTVPKTFSRGSCLRIYAEVK